MKKLLSLVMTAVLALGLVGCAKESPAPEQKEPVVITVQAEGPWAALYVNAANRVMEANPDTKILIHETGSFDNLDLIDSTDATNEDVTDVFAIPADRLYGLAENFVLASLPAKEMATNIGGFGDYDAGLGGLLQIEGDYLAFPMNIETLINFTNTANAAALGVDLSQPVELTEIDPNTFLIPLWNTWFGVALTNSADIEMLGKNADGSFFSDLTKDFSELTQEQQDLFTALFNYYEAHQAIESPVFTADIYGYMDENFKTGGENVLRIDGPWATDGLEGHAGEDMGLLPIGAVTVNGNPLAHWKGGWGLAINSRIEEDAAKMDLAQKFIEELMNPSNAAEWFTAAGKIIPNAPEGAYAELSATNQSVIESVYASYDAAPNRPLFKEWGNVWTTWENSMKSWPSVKPATAEEAYNEVKAAFEAMMAQF